MNKYLFYLKKNIFFIYFSLIILLRAFTKFAVFRYLCLNLRMFQDNSSIKFYPIQLFLNHSFTLFITRSKAPYDIYLSEESFFYSI
jgi:hypothetical protein